MYTGQIMHGSMGSMRSLHWLQLLHFLRFDKQSFKKFVDMSIHLSKVAYNSVRKHKKGVDSYEKRVFYH